MRQYRAENMGMQIPWSYDNKGNELFIDGNAVTDEQVQWLIENGLEDVLEPLPPPPVEATESEASQEPDVENESLEQES